MKTLTKVCAGALLAVGMAFNAAAIPVGSDYLIGHVAPSQPPGNLDQAHLTHLINLYNGDPSVPPSAHTYTLNPGINVPAPDLPAVISGVKTETPTGNTLIDLGASSYTYIAAKFGANMAFYYIGGLSGEITIEVPDEWNGLTGLGLSHYTLYNGTPNRTPDGGSMLALLGGAVAVLGFLRRKISA